MNLFGNTTGGTASGTGNTSSSNSFGAAKLTGTSNLFGGSSTGTGGGLFGGNSAATSNPTLSSGGLFGGGASSNPSAGGAGTGTFGSGGTASTNPLFGGSFGIPKPAEQGTSDASKPAAPSSLFRQPNTNTSATNATAPATGNLFGLPPKPTEGPTPAGTAASSSGGGLFGGGLFGKPSAPATSTAGTPAAPAFSLGGIKDSNAPAPQTGGLFGSLGPSVKPTDNKDAAPAAPTLNLFSAAKSDEKKDTATPNLTKANEQSKTSDTAGSTSLTGTTGATVAVPPPSMLRGKTLEEIVNRWSSELESHVREFSKFAGEVAVWDRALIENGNHLAALYNHVLAAERQQNDIDQSLDHIEQQQKDLASTLDAYEKVSQEVLGGQGGSLRTLDTGPADTERDKNYMLATDLHTQLDDLSGSLTQMIDSVNTLSVSSKPSDTAGDDPMTQVAQILSSHLESLQWIDGAVREVERKVSEVEKRVKESGLNGSSVGGTKSRGFGLNR
ncbi:Nsp1-like C-terminal region-domain-containing protein [Crucibulum laeve]|uniref:Nucleoporin NSP1 n=1 Tax=Crucibulum laeve TaxID=68775 RepID=A0A5C3MDK1_9AGAR|nr:Nsp1-like C-terminal region-domain-containing protein [Crucibulum laeve]